MFYNASEKSLKIVSIPQLVTDLLEEGRVCVEAAEKLMEKVESIYNQEQYLYMLSYINITIMPTKVKVKAKQWGSSLGFIIPNEVVKEQKIREGDELEIELQKLTDIEKLFGIAHGKRPAGLTTQKIKDELRAGWHD